MVDINPGTVVIKDNRVGIVGRITLVKRPEDAPEWRADVMFEGETEFESVPLSSLEWNDPKSKSVKKRRRG